MRMQFYTLGSLHLCYYFCYIPHNLEPKATGEAATIGPSAVREITKGSSTFAATNFSSNMIWLFQMHDIIQMKSNYAWIHYK